MGMHECKGGCGGFAPEGHEMCHDCCDGARLLNEMAVKRLRERNTELMELCERHVRNCRRCNGYGVVLGRSLSSRGPYDAPVARPCPDCHDTRKALGMEVKITLEKENPDG